MNWFRFYHEALDDPKVQRLPGETFKVWVNLLCLASRAKPRGQLPLSADIAFALRMPVEEIDDVLQVLFGCGLLDQTDDGLIPHNWTGRQPVSDDVAARVRKHRAVAKWDRTLPGNTPETNGNVTRNTLEKKRGEKKRELMSNNDGSNAAAASYPTLLDGKYRPIREKFTSLDPRFTDGMFRTMLHEAQQQFGPVAADTLLDALRQLLLALDSQFKAEKAGGKPVGNLKPYARQILVSKLQEETHADD